MRNFHSEKKQNGQVIIPALVFGSVAIIVVTGFLSWASLNLRLSRQIAEKEQSLQIAEAGNDYYRWHLAHAKTDYQDGTGGAGPYVHEFRDKDGNVVGTFALEITPPSTGSTMTTIKSTGKVNGDVTTERHVQTRLAIPTIAKYAVASNSEVRFGTGTEIFGPIHSNGGIRFDGFAHNVVSSAKETYTDPDSPNDRAFGVHTHIAPADPTIPPSPLPLPAVPVRPDVFEAGREFPVPAIDFAGLTPDLQTMKTDANASGIYLAPSGRKGYHLVLRNNNTVDIYRVNTLTSPAWNCQNQEGANSYWGTWTISSETFLRNSTLPANGLVFVEDDAWVDGVVNNSRVTIAAARFPDTDSTRASITINRNLTYTNYGASATTTGTCTGSTDSVGLIAQRNINIGLGSADNLRIDAALIAQYGRVGRYYYNSNYCGSNSLRDSVTLFGMIASNTRYGFSWSCSGDYCSGYDIRNISYDARFLYCAPPSFPLTSDQYETISWDEVS